jgi:hypothetical protein
MGFCSLPEKRIKRVRSTWWVFPGMAYQTLMTTAQEQFRRVEGRENQGLARKAC